MESASSRVHAYSWVGFLVIIVVVPSHSASGRRLGVTAELTMGKAKKRGHSGVRMMKRHDGARSTSAPGMEAL